MSAMRLPLILLFVLLRSCIFASSVFLIKNPVDGLVPCHPQHIQALTQFKNEFDSSGCNQTDYFNGVWCDNTTGEVTRLKLPEGCLRGTLSSNSSLFSLDHLRYLDLSYNNFNSSVPSELGNLNILEVLILSSNGFIETGCGITQFPNFLKNLHNLEHINLSNNNISGKVPEWLWKLPRLSALALVNNSFTGFEGSVELLVNSSISFLDLALNHFKGPFPNPPHSLKSLSAWNNSFTGNIPLSICNRSSLDLLDLSYNKFTGSIPPCLSNFQSSLIAVNLRKNNLEGNLPDMCYDGALLRTLDVGYNRLTGKLPRSLLNCSRLRFLSVDNNRIKDTFPFWLKALPYLQALTLRSNEFYGPISPSDQGSFAFPAYLK
ncbi:unnamed protein product [Brassica oleracea var. botrytis]